MMKLNLNLETTMISRKRSAAAESEETKPVIPRTLIAEITACAIRLTSNRAHAHRKCGRRACRTGRSCAAEGLGNDGMAPCAAHWAEHDHSFFFGAFTFGVLNLCPRLPDCVDPQDARWEEGVEDNPFDLVPQITFVHRSEVETS